MHSEFIKYSNDIYTNYIFTIQNLCKHFINKQYKVAVVFYNNVKFSIINAELKILIYFQNK